MQNKINHYIKIIEEKTTSKTFCPLPWIHVATRPNGDMRLCCGSNASGAGEDHSIGLVKKDDRAVNFGIDGLSEFNNEFMRNLRLQMLNNEIPSSCSKCFEEEQNGVVSKRLWETYEWVKDGLDLEELVSTTDIDGHVPFKIQYLDLRLGNTCNLKCVMCSPQDSSRWTQDYDKLMSITTNKHIKIELEYTPRAYNFNWYESEQFWEQVYEQIPNIKHLYFAGGEPLMIKEHKRFLQELINRGYSKDISLRYNSNGTYVNEDMIDIWSKFKQVRYAFSIDNIFERNHYIRFPANWEDVERTLDLMDNTPENIHCSIACAVQVLNIKTLIDFAKWKIGKNYKKINQYRVDEYVSGGGIINLHLVYIPTFMSARVLSTVDKQEIANDLKDFKLWLFENYTQDDSFWCDNPYGWKRWESILKFIEAEDHSHLQPQLKEYLLNLDTIRGTNVVTTFPELSHLFD